MHITRQADYAARTVLYLAKQEPGARIATATIAQQQGIPTSFLAKIILQLCAAGIVHTVRGARGGVKLARPAAEISLLEIVEAIDGPVEINDCVLDASRCFRSEECDIRPTWCEIHADLIKLLQQTKFGQLANEKK